MKSLAAMLFLCLGVIVASAQEDDKRTNKKDTYSYNENGFEKGKFYLITRHDGVEYIGEIKSDDGHELAVYTRKLGLMYIPKYEIKSIHEIVDEESIVFDEYQAAGPFTTRYSFTTNALPIKKGENYGMLNLYGPEAHLALNDHLNVGIMATWIASPVALATKYSFLAKESRVNVSVGTLLGTSGYLNNFKGYGGLHWLNITFGDRKKNLTFSGGYAYLQAGNYEPPEGVYNEMEYDLAGDENTQPVSTSHGPVFSIAGIFKIGAKSSFVFDSMIGYFSFEKITKEEELDETSSNTIYTVTRMKNANTTALFLMPGVRFQNTDRKAFQICVAGVSSFGDVKGSFPVPMVTWFYKF
jgi:hypothetical protein